MPFDSQAGQKIGTEVWRIEKMEPARVNAADHGKFYSGDCYIVLKTFEKSGAIYQDLHFWLGEKASQDERGAVAYQTVYLDDMLGGKPVQHREVQGHESAKFLAIFPNIQYLDGGVDSAFRHVDPSAYKPRLFHLKGKRHVRVQQVPLTADSLNQGDVFILDLGLRLFQWNGTHANKYEKVKGLDVVTHINGDERGGKAEVVVLESGKDDNADFWAALGGKKAVRSADQGGSDDEVKTTETRLFHVGAGNSLTQVATGTLERSALQTSDIFLLDSDAVVYVWIGKNSDKEVRKNVMIQASEFLRNSGKADWTPITRVSEGVEPAAFQQLFKLWTPPRTVGAAQPREEVKVDLESLRARKSAEQSMVDDATGKLDIWRIENMQKVPVPKSQYGQFFSGDSYILLYTYLAKNREKYIIYFWQGRDSSSDEKGASALLTKQLDDSMNGEPVQVRVVQNKEPNHFLALFKGRMVVHHGGVASAFNNRSDVSTIDLEGVGLYHVHGTSAINTRAAQVAATASSLNSGDTFILRTPDAIHVWQGAASNDEERQVAHNIANVIKGNRAVHTVNEDSESDAFWEALGGKGDYPRVKTIDQAAYEPRLFHCTTASRGYFTVEEIPDFSQEDLINDDVMLLDAYDEIYVWVGHDATKEERDKAITTALEYVKNAKDGRSADTPIFKVLAGSEPPNFTCHFHGWNDEKASNFADPYLKKLGQLKTSSGESKQPAVERVGASDVGYSDPTKTKHSYEDLKANKAANIDLTRKEEYLADADFLSIFGVSRADFQKLPKWKQADQKKKVHLF